MKKHFVHQAYKTNSVVTLSPSEMSLRLFTRCLECLKESKEMIENGDIEGRNRTLKKAQEIILELMNLLNMEEEASKVILSFYDYLLASLVEANIRSDNEKIIEVEKYITELQIAMKEAVMRKRLKSFLSDQI